MTQRALPTEEAAAQAPGRAMLPVPQDVAAAGDALRLQRSRAGAEGSWV